MKTHFKIQHTFFSAAKKYAFTIALIATVAIGAAAQTNTFPSSGNAGVNTTSPPNPLTVARSGSAPYTSRPANELLQLVDRTDNTPQILFGSAYNGMILRYTGTDGTALNQRLGVFTGAGGEAFVINNDGLVGIGTTAPGVKLDVKGYIAAGSLNGFVFTDDLNTGLTSSAPDKLNLVTGGTIRLHVDKAGNVGIGTTTPGTYYGVQTKVEISSATYGVLNVNSGNGYSGGLSLSRGGTSDWIISNRADGIAGRLAFFNAAGTEQVKFLQNGNVEVAGTINAKYQDLAEWVPSAEQLSAGTVVVLDTTKSNQVVSSGTAYDTRVAGVISAQPGITLGESGEGKVLVATTGRVRVKVDASRGPIQIGDLLVTSDVSGVAMKSEPVEFAGRKMHMPGTIIGKALEPLAKGKGEILVLLSLQ